MKRALWMILAAVIAFALVLLLGVPALLDTNFVQSEIRKQIEQFLPEHVEIGKLGLRTFPWPHILVTDLKIDQQIVQNNNLKIHAPTVEILPRLWKLIFRKVELSRLSIDNGQLQYRFSGLASGSKSEIALDQIRLHASDVRSHRYLKLGGEARFYGQERNMRLKLEYDFPEDVSWWKGAFLSADLTLTDVDLAKWQSAFVSSTGGYLEGGNLSGRLRLRKDRKSDQCEIALEMEAHNISYQPYGKQEIIRLDRIELDVEAAYEIPTRLLIIHEASVESGLADMSVKGQVDFSKNLTSDGLDLEISMPEIFWEVFPKTFSDEWSGALNIAGTSRGNIVLKGGVKAMTVKSEINLTDSLIRYPEVLEKPAGAVLETSGEFSYGEDRTVRGDFEMHLQDMVAKGTLVGYQPLTNDYEVTFITNKFLIGGLPDIFPSLRVYRMEGSAKWLLNIKGNATRGSVDHIRTHLNAEQISMGNEAGMFIEDLNGTLDYQGRDLHLSDVNAQWKGLPVSASFDSFGVFPTSFTYRMGLGKGSIQGKGALDRSGRTYFVSTAFNAQGIELAELIPRLTGQNSFEGTAAAQGSVKCAGHDLDGLVSSFNSAGALHVENGRLNTIDIMAALGTVEKLIMLAVESRGGTRFAAMDTNYDYAGGQLTLADGLLHSDQLDAEFRGTISKEEGYNIPIDILLSYKLSKQVIAGLAQGQVVRIPALLGGPIDQPQIKVTESVLGATLSSLIHKWTDGRLGKSLVVPQQGENSPFIQNQPASDDSQSGSFPVDQTQPSEDGTTSAVPPPTPEEQLLEAGLGILSGLLGDQRKQ